MIEMNGPYRFGDKLKYKRLAKKQVHGVVIKLWNVQCIIVKSGVKNSEDAKILAALCCPSWTVLEETFVRWFF